jgi:hypothetical protein
MTITLSAAVVLDPAEEYFPQAGYRVARSDGDILRLYPFQKNRIWAAGSRATEVCQRLAEEERLSYVRLRPCLDWLRELRLPEVLKAGHEDELRRAFRAALPQDARGAASCVELWLAERFPAVFRLLDSPDDLAAHLDRGDDAAPVRAALLWVCGRRPDSQRHQLVAEVLRSPDPVAAWFGLRDEDDLGWVERANGFFPQNLPAALSERLGRHWRDRLVTAAGFEAAARVVAQNVGALRRVVRQQAEEIYRTRPPAEQRRLEASCCVVFGDEWVLQQAARQAGWSPLDPGADVGGLLEWYSTYRARLDWRSVPESQRVAAAQSFGEWFLRSNRFRAWCAQGDKGPLLFRVHSFIRDEVKQSTVLLIIVDGLGYWEHGQLIQKVQDEVANLQVTMDVPILATLPTITAVCKGSLLSGRPQREWGTPNYRRMAAECALRQRRTHYHDHFPVDTVIEQMQDAQTSLVVVNYTGLDSELHAATEGGSIPGKVAGRLSELSANVAGVVRALEGQVEGFAVLVASDHGQVVGACEGDEAPGDVVRQRLRLARGEQLPFEVALSRDDTLCSQDYWAIADARAWGRAGTKLFGCHGGLFPEEVLTRLTTLKMAAPELRVEVTVSGSGVGGVDGNATLRIKNLSPVPVTVRRAWLNWRDRNVPLLPPAHPVPAYSERVLPAQTVGVWPAPEDAPSARARVAFVAPAGREEQQAEGAAELTSDPGYEVSVFRL